jgi:hypothetical protein
MPDQTLTLITEDFPPILLKTLKTTANKHASIFCSIKNLNDKLKELKDNKEQGKLPKNLEFKFKNMFIAENETALRTTMIKSTIDLEIIKINSKIMELQTLHDNRLSDLSITLTTPLQDCGINIDATAVKKLFETFLTNAKLEFLFKQQKDIQAKIAKAEKFALRKEQDNAIATLSTREVAKLNKDIIDLKKLLSKKQTNDNKSKQNKSKQTKSNTKPKNEQGSQAKKSNKSTNAKKVKSTGNAKKPNGNHSKFSRNK